ncbi:MAG: hypothetical protein P4M00_07935 [Azospirillaceae bacterium]|nr:hypothetical protein [Azospirillaceae bacterium]
MTTHIPMIDPATASPAVRAAYDGEIATRGRITNMKKTLLQSLPVFHTYMEFYTLYNKLIPVIGKRGVWLFCHAISSGNACLICTTYFRRLLIDEGLRPETYAPTAEEQELIDFGHQVSRAHGGAKPDPALWTALKARYTNEQLVDIVGLGGQMVANNLFNDIVEVELDDQLYDYRAAEPAK